jgi:hypothetical protein
MMFSAGTSGELRETSNDITLAPDAMFRLVDGEGCVFDLTRGAFAGLNATATKLLGTALHIGGRQTIERLSVEWNVAPSLVETYLDVTRSELQSRRLLAAPRPNPVVQTWAIQKLHNAGEAAATGCLRQLKRRCQNAGSRRALARRTRALLRVSWGLLRVFGLSRSLQLFRNATDDPRATGPQGRLDELDELIQTEAGRMLLPIACKERSLAAFFLLRSLGWPHPRVIIGLQRHPFRAHAWVDCQGRVLTDHSEHCAFYVPVAELD